MAITADDVGVFFEGLFEKGSKLANDYLDYRLENRAMEQEFNLYSRQQEYLARGYSTIPTQGGVYDQSQQWSNPAGGQSLLGGNTGLLLIGGLAAAGLIYLAVK